MEITVFNYDNSANPWAAGGASEYNNELLKHLAKKHEITIYTSGHKNFIKPRRVNNILYYPLNSSRTYINSKLHYWSQVFKHIRKIKTDIIFENWLYPFPLMLQFFSKKPVVLICHGTYGRHSINKFGLFGLLVYFLEKVYRYYYKWVFNVSPTSLKEFKTKTKLLVPPGRGNTFSKIKFLKSKGDYIAMLCRIDIYQKGLDIVRDIASEIPFPIKIAGGGHKLKKYKKSVKSNNVSFVGSLHGEKKVKFLSECRFLLMPSRYEGFGISALEAQACNKPVVGFDIPDLNFCVANNRSGLLVKPYNKKDLTKAIQRLITDDKLLAKLGRQAKEHAKKFSYKDGAQKINLFLEKHFKINKKSK